MHPTEVGLESLIGKSPVMADLSRAIRKAARCDWTVLIQGETGTGKGVVARVIHRLSPRAARPFVIVNCGAIPDNLVESELFGYERGAFTGADRPRRGKFEAAAAGTIFLDEVGELSLAAQARLLHVLQDREIERLGGEGRRIPVQARVIAATNRNLEQRVADGAFRQDLFFRLDVFPIRTPSLRQRSEDIPALAQDFALKCAAHSERRISGISPAVLDVFRKHPWPGNVRQLENVVQRAVAMGETDQVLLEDLPDDFLSVRLAESESKVRNFYEAMDETARQVCIAAFTISRGNCVIAARLMGLHRNSVYRLIRRYGLNYLLETTAARGSRQPLSD
jgi:transcriptional regulator with GAF, ATPase, and Fis domain